MTKQQGATMPKAATKSGSKKKFKPLISDERVLEMHAAMLRMRGVLEPLRKNSAERKRAGLVPLAEGGFAGLLTGLGTNDVVFASKRWWQVRAILGANSSPETTDDGEALENCVLVPDEIDAVSLVAMGVGAAAMASQGAKSRGRVVLAIVEDVDPDALAAIAVVATARNLPLIVVSFGLLNSKRAQKGRQAKTSARLPVMMVDGCDPMAVHRVGQEGLTRARSGLGGSFIKCVLNAPGAVDPVAALEQVLLRRHLFSERKSDVILSNSK